MPIPYPLHGVLERLIIKDPLLVSHFKQFPYNLFVEFWMSLHSDQAISDVHTLDLAAGSVAEVFNEGRVSEDNVSMHLVDVLPGIGSSGIYIQCKTRGGRKGFSTGVGIDMSHTSTSFLNNCLPLSVKFTDVTATSHPLSLRSTLTPIARPTI